MTPSGHAAGNGQLARNEQLRTLYEIARGFAAETGRPLKDLEAEALRNLSESGIDVPGPARSDSGAAMVPEDLPPRLIETAEQSDEPTVRSRVQAAERSAQSAAGHAIDPVSIAVTGAVVVAIMIVSKAEYDRENGWRLREGPDAVRIIEAMFGFFKGAAG
jgi:hypothetical protein